MGNRAVITTKENFENNGIGIYLHWNGGYDSVSAFLEYCQLRQFRGGQYGLARLTQVISNFFGGGLSIGIDIVSRLDCDNWDNGVYLIDDNFNIVGRKFFEGCEQNSYDRIDMLKSIDEKQPEDDRLGGFITAKKVSYMDIHIGDDVYIFDNVYGKYEKVKVIGFGKNMYVNGRNVNGVPYCNKYNGGEKNVNNYILPAIYYGIGKEETKRATKDMFAQVIYKD